MPVYNCERFLKESIKSVLVQSFQNWELIAVNDGSTDNSLSLLKDFHLQDKRIQIINLKKNRGLSYARNQGVKIAKGKYLFFLDSDDFLQLNCFSVLSKFLKKKYT